MADHHSYPRDFFLTLLATVALYASVISGLTLLFQFINLAFPDPLDYAEGIRGGIRWGSAMLTILFPVFAFTTIFLHRDLTAHPEKTEYRIRKWLLYLTVFVAALVIIGDLIALLFNFLNGDLTVRFLCKILAIGIVTGLVFGYELRDVRRTHFARTARDRTITGGMTAFVVVVILAGFFLGGSPFEQRRIRFDEQRINDLQQIQSQVIDYWVNKGTLPNKLDDLQNALIGFALPVDPSTHESYGYEQQGKDKLTFLLCATFETTSASANRNRGSVPLPETMDYWDHEAGKICFVRHIDPALYRERLGKPVPPPTR